MRETIVQELRKLEEQHGITILFACETGSRAWGFPSPDSDYDVRFIYMHPRDWYLSLDDHKDTLELMQGDLDFVGWDIRKALRLLRKSNASMFEKLQSPIVYLEQTDFRKKLLHLAPNYFSPKAGLHHYLGMASNVFKSCEQVTEVKLKSYLYLLRTTLASLWITNCKSIPPLQFQELFQLLEADKLVDKLHGLVKLKAQVNETYLHSKDPDLELFARNCISQCDDLADELPRVLGPIEPLEQLFRETISAVETLKV